MAVHNKADDDMREIDISAQSEGPTTPDGSLVLDPPKGCLQQRYVVAVMAFFGNFCCYSLRVNLSVAMVAMVNQTAVAGGSVKNLTDECPVPIPLNDTVPDKDGEFVWDQATQGMILGSFFWGYIVTQIPGGYIAQRYSGKWTYGLGVVCTGLFTLLTPVAARTGVWALLLVRILEGLGEGVTVPSLNAILTRWAPPLERTQMSCIAFIGMHMGTVVSMPVTGLLCQYGFAGGWPSAFYVFGLLSIVWFIFWCLLVFDGPEHCPYITNEEKIYIHKTTGFNQTIGKQSEVSTPWIDILASSKLWAVLVAHTANNWGFYTLLTSLPQYMSEVLHFNIKENSFLSALPYLAFVCFGTPLAFIADATRRRGWLRTTTVRKIANTFGLILPGIFLITAGYVGCDRYWAVACVILSVMSGGFCLSGYNVNHMDLAPRHTGILVGITNTAATIPGMLGPYIVGLLTNEQPTRSRWQIVFYITASIYAFGAIFYLIFGSGSQQPWNEHGKLTETFRRRLNTMKSRNEDYEALDTADDNDVPELSRNVQT